MPATCGQSGEKKGYCIGADGDPIELFPTRELLFDSSSEITESFSFETGADIRNGEEQTYTSEPENVAYVENELLIVAREEDGQYTSGSVELLDPVLFGRVEAEIMADVGSGASPSFWLLPSDPGAPQEVCDADMVCSTSSWPAWGGLVIMSGRADLTAWATASFATEQDSVLNEAEESRDYAVETLDSEFHRYAIEWGPERIDWFLDGDLVHSFDISSDEIFHPEGENPFHRPFRVKLNLSVGGLVEDPVPEDFPAEMRVRALRVFEYR